MDRRRAEDTYRKRVALGVGISIGVHALVLSSLTLRLPDLAGGPPARPLQLVEIPEAWRDAALEVVALESAPRVDADRDRAAAAAPSPAAASAATGAPPAPAGATATALLARPAPTAAAVEAPSLELTPVAEPLPSTAELASTGSRAGRGVVLRADAGTAVSGGFDLRASSDAARDAERDRDGERGWEREGRGIGISISGPGGGSCGDPGGIGVIGSGGLGGVPTGGKGHGIIGLRPPNAGAINRMGPKIGG